ncbi:hypothetical protein LshimejAT787_1702400 [Lyophyllum shimeji]|uniref:Uncharacterized protein n=1 Tax=Lyophyllum shimeji TaxID=47721 RepID=A0A9P3PZX5_LYOSH|nr:hypothetical protein LshimejAT787_1702400 [Lyophyllum shimeji]
MEEAGQRVQADDRDEWPDVGGMGVQYHIRRTQRKRKPDIVVSIDLAGSWKELLAQLRFSTRLPDLQYLDGLVESLQSYLERVLPMGKNLSRFRMTDFWTDFTTNRPP